MRRVLIRLNELFWFTTFLFVLWALSELGS